LSYTRRISAKQSGFSIPRIPLKGDIDLTYRCNNYCRHCWLITPDRGGTGAGELSLQEWISLIDQARAEGTREWSISGGEPLLRSDFAELISYIKSKSMYCSVFTNGMLITPEIARLLKGCDLQVSLYGATADVYDHVTRHPGGYDRMMQGVARLREAGTPFTIRAFPMRDNFHQWPAMLELAHKLAGTVRIGATWLFLSASGDPARNAEIAAQRLTPDEVIGLEPPDVCHDEDLLESMAPLDLDRSKGLYAACLNSREQFHIDPFGMMSFCSLIKDPRLRYDVRNGSFAEGWWNFIPSLAAFGRGDQEYAANCGACRLHASCRMCPSYSYLEHRRHAGKVDYICTITDAAERYRENWRRNHRRFLSIGGFSIQVDSDRPFTADTLDVRFDPFLAEGVKGERLRLQFRYELPDISDKELGELIYDQAPWRVYSKRNGWIHQCYVGDGKQRKIMQTAVFNQDYSRATIYSRGDDYFTAAVGRETLTYFPSDLLWLSQVLAHRRGFYLHSAGMIIRNQGVLFVGHSTAGKSTSIKLFSGRGEVLCDDRNILRKRPEGWRVYGSWSHGELPMVSPASAPLRAIFFLEKSSINRITVMSDPVERRNRLLACLIRPVVTPEWWEKTLPLVNEAAATIPCYTMQFDKSGGIVEIVQDLLGQGDGLAKRRSFVCSPEEVCHG